MDLGEGYPGVESLSIAALSRKAVLDEESTRLKVLLGFGIGLQLRVKGTNDFVTYNDDKFAVMLVYKLLLVGLVEFEFSLEHGGHLAKFLPFFYTGSLTCCQGGCQRS